MNTICLSHKRFLTRLTLALHAAIAFFLFLAASLLPSFDSSALLVLSSRWSTSLLRWDTSHYAHIARNGYVYEHEYAFFPGTPLLMRFGQQLLKLTGVSANEESIGLLIAGALASILVAINTVHTLYDFSVHHLGSTSMALLASLLSLLSSSPATLRYAPLPEPFFTWLSYRGMLYVARRRYTLASAAFTLASMFRSNGVILVGYIIWGMLVEPLLHDSSLRRHILSTKVLRKTIFTAILALPPLLPFLWHQYKGYIAFCSSPVGDRRPWCGSRLPLIYSFVQSEYWDVGLFRYWTPQQAPNILLAGPVLVLLVYASFPHIVHTFIPRLLSLARGPRHTVASSPPSKQRPEVIETTAVATNPLMNHAITPHAIHSLILSFILLFAAHTQIALRFACSLPFTYWAAAWLFIDNLDPRVCHSDSREVLNDENREEKLYPTINRAARWWVSWSVVWGAISLVTWSVFLPPA